MSVVKPPKVNVPVVFPIDTLPVPVPKLVTSAVVVLILVDPVNVNPPVPWISPVPELTPIKFADPSLPIVAVSVLPSLTTIALRFAPML